MGINPQTSDSSRLSSAAHPSPQDAEGSSNGGEAQGLHSPFLISHFRDSAEVGGEVLLLLSLAAWA